MTFDECSCLIIVVATILTEAFDGDVCTYSSHFDLRLFKVRLPALIIDKIPILTHSHSPVEKEKNGVHTYALSRFSTCAIPPSGSKREWRRRKRSIKCI